MVSPNATSDHEVSSSDVSLIDLSIALISLLKVVEAVSLLVYASTHVHVLWLTSVSLGSELHVISALFRTVEGVRIVLSSLAWKLITDSVQSDRVSYDTDTHQFTVDDPEYACHETSVSDQSTYDIHWRSRLSLRSMSNASAVLFHVCEIRIV